RRACRRGSDGSSSDTSCARSAAHPSRWLLAVKLIRVGVLFRVERASQLLRLVRVVVVRDEVIDAHAAHPGDTVVPRMERRLQGGERLGSALLQLLAERFRARLELSVRHDLVDEAERLGLLRVVLPVEIPNLSRT